MNLWGFFKGILILDESDRTKQLSVEIDSSATTGTKTTLKSAQTADRMLNLPDADDTLVGKVTVDVFENKDIDADNNTISNLENDNIKTGAAIDAEKIHDGSVTNTEFEYINTLSSNAQDQIDSKQSLSEKGQPNGYASLDGSGQIPAGQIPPSASGVDSVNGEVGVVVLDTDDISEGVNKYANGSIDTHNDVDTSSAPPSNGDVLEWDGSNWVPGTPSGGGSSSLENISLLLNGNINWNKYDAAAGDTLVKESADFSSGHVIVPNSQFGFVFTAPRTGDIRFLVLRYVDNGNTTGSMLCKLYAVDGSGVPTGAPLAQTSSLGLSSVPNGIDQQSNFIFTTNPTLTAGEKYAIMIENNNGDANITLKTSSTNDNDDVNYEETAFPYDNYQLAADQNSVHYQLFFNNLPAVNTIVLENDIYVSIPSLPQDRHTIEAQTIVVANDQVAYIEIDRSAASTTIRTVTVDDIINIVPDNNKLVFAQAFNDDCYIGLSDLTRIVPNDSASF